MKLSCAVLTAAAVEASDYLSHCNPSTFDDELCIRNCQINREVGQTVSREKYGKHNWLYKDLGFTGQETYWLGDSGPSRTCIKLSLIRAVSQKRFLTTRESLFKSLERKVYLIKR